MRRAGLIFGMVCLGVSALTASGDPPTNISARTKGAAKVVVATVVDVQSHFAVNQWGDRLIVTDAVVDVDETLKGAHASALTMTVEGGTVGELTLRVSDMPTVKKGDRGVFFLDPTTDGRHVPHDRGRGLLKLDGNNRVQGSTLTLDEVKRQVRSSK